MVHKPLVTEPDHSRRNFIIELIVGGLATLVVGQWLLRKGIGRYLIEGEFRVETEKMMGVSEDSNYKYFLYPKEVRGFLYSLFYPGDLDNVVLGLPLIYDAKSKPVGEKAYFEKYQGGF